jgi:hypothetical protein
MVVGYAAILGSCFAFDEHTTFPGLAALIPVLGTFLAILGGSDAGPPATGSRAIDLLRPLVWLGDISYSWYLWHWPMIVLAAAWRPSTAWKAAAAVAALLPAWASYKLLERRFLVPRPRPLRTTAVGTTCMLLPVIGVVVTAPAIRSNTGATEIARISATQDHADKTAGCEGFPLGQLRTLSRCTWGDVSSGRVVLIGDSNAGHFSETVIGAADARGVAAQISTLNSCPFVDLDVALRQEGDGFTARCRDFVTANIADLRQSPPDVVLIAAATDVYLHLDGVTLADRATGRIAVSEADRAEQFEAGLARTVEQLTGVGIRVVVLNVVPKPWAANLTVDVRSCSYLLLTRQPGRCGFDPYRYEEELTPSSIGVENSAAASAGATTWDFADELCPNGTCRSVIDDTLVWVEPLHITVEAAQLLVPSAATRLDELLSRSTG